MPRSHPALILLLSLLPAATAQAPLLHLHVGPPEGEVPHGGPIGFYFHVEAHGSMPGPVPNATILLTVHHDAYVTDALSLTTNAEGRAFARIHATTDQINLTWNATARGTHEGEAFELHENGTLYLRGSHDDLTRRVDVLQGAVDRVRFEGVHLDDLGSRNLSLAMARGIGILLAILLAAALVSYIATRL